MKKFKIKGHRGTWYSLDSRNYIINGKETDIYLFEHELYGGEAACVIADSEGNVLLEDVYNGWDDWYEYILDPQDYNRMYQNIIVERVL